MAAWPFINPWMLLGLAGIAAPIIIHWLSRRRYRRIDWAAMRFLREAENEQRRRRQLEQWLLLFLRCLAAALLAMVIARPFVRPGLLADLLGSGGQRHRILVIDDSASLGYRSGTRNDFERVIATAQRTIEWLAEVRPGDTLSAYLTSDSGAPLWTDLRLTGASIDEPRRILRDLRVSDLPARPADTLSAVADEAASAQRVEGVDVYILSDFRRSEWTDPDSNQDGLAPLRTLDPEQVRLVLVAAGDAQRENIALEFIRPTRSHVIAGNPTPFEVAVANHGGRPLERVAVELEVDGLVQPPIVIERVEPGALESAVTELTIPSPGYVEVKARLTNGDSLAIDDRFTAAIDVLPALRVLLVNGAPAAEPARDEIFYLRSALAPPGAFASGVRIEVVDPADLAGVELTAFDCILICNAAPLEPSAVELLRRYARAGGGVAFFLGDMIGSPPAQHEALGTDPHDGLLPTTLEAVRTPRPDESPVRLRLLDDAEPPLFPADLGFAESVAFQRYYELAEPSSDSGARVVARFTNPAGSPALVTRRFGAGRIALFASTVDADWNNWPRAVDGSYVIAMLELVHQLAWRRQEQTALRAGDPLVADVPPDTPGSIQIRPPDFPERPAIDVLQEASSTQTGTAFVGPPVEFIGVYTVVAGQNEIARVAVNVHPIISPLASADERELRALTGGLPTRWTAAGDDVMDEEATARRELWPLLLALLIAALVAEQCLIDRIDRRERLGERRAASESHRPSARAA